MIETETKTFMKESDSFDADLTLEKDEQIKEGVLPHSLFHSLRVR